METKFSYTVIGLFVIIFTVAFFVIVLWLSIGFTKTTYDEYIVFMKESVSGLSVKAPVKYNGVGVGFVDSITLSDGDPSQVQLVLDVQVGTPITVGTTAQLDSQGVTGIGYIELKGGQPHEAPLVAKRGQLYPVIPTKPSLLFRLDTMLGNLDTNIENATHGLKSFLSEGNAKSFSDMLINLNQVSGRLNEDSVIFTKIINNAEITLSNAADASQALPSLINTLKTSANNFDSISGDIKEASKEIKTTFVNSTVMIENMNQQVLPEVIEALDKIQTLLSTVNTLGEQLDENPSVLIRGRVPSKPGPGEE